MGEWKDNKNTVKAHILMKSRPVNWILENNLLINSSKVADLNAEINGTSDL